MGNHLVFLQVLLFPGLSFCQPEQNHSGINNFDDQTTHSQKLENGKFPEFPTEFSIADDYAFLSKIHSSDSLEDDYASTTATSTIMILGLNGSGVEETIIELIGPSTSCEQPEGQPSTLENVLTNIDSSHNYTIKLVHIPDFSDGGNSNENTKILSSINSYIYQNGYPDYFLVISRFDDNKFDNEQSSFIQFLKQIELFQKFHKNGTAENIVILLTNVMSMSTSKGTQRRPERKVNQFRTAIESYTSFPKPITLIVGENDAATKYGVELVNGYTKLPNKELYPKNVWQAFINVSREFLNSKQVLTAVINNREREMTCRTQFLTKFPNETFSLKTRKYNNSLNIGYGYDLLKGELLAQTPFQLNSTHASPVGYELPNILKCQKLSEPDVQYFKVFSQSIFEYNLERLHYLNFPGKINLSQCFLEFEPKEGFNIKSGKDDENATLSSVLAIHTVNCVLDNKNVNFTEEFLEVVNSLNEFDSSNKSSVIEWQEFFETFGSHIVIGSYGGGSMNSNLVLDIPNLVLEGNVENILNSMVEFTTVPEIGIPTYNFVGGDLNTSEIDGLQDLANERRNELLDRWAKSLDTNFAMLDYSLDLQPISDFVKMFSKEKGNYVENAVELLLKRKLKYSAKRKKRPSVKNEAGITHIDSIPINETISDVSTPENAANGSKNSEEAFDIDLTHQQNVTVAPVDVHAKIDQIVSNLSKPKNLTTNSTETSTVHLVIPQNFRVKETIHEGQNSTQLLDLRNGLQNPSSRETAKPTRNVFGRSHYPISRGVYVVRNSKPNFQPINHQQPVPQNNAVRSTNLAEDKHFEHWQIIEKLKLEKCSRLREQQKQCLLTYSYSLCKIYSLPQDC